MASDKKEIRFGFTDEERVEVISGDFQGWYGEISILGLTMIYVILKEPPPNYQKTKQEGHSPWYRTGWFGPEQLRSAPAAKLTEVNRKE